jgi:hypothetical protein
MSAERPDIRPDIVHELTFGETEVLVNAKYDRIDVFRALGIWMIKVIDDEHGLMTAYVDEQSALNIAKIAMLPIVERPFIFQTEYDNHIEVMASALDDSWYGVGDIVIDDSDDTISDDQ